MSTDLTPFNFEGNNVRIQMDDAGDPWWVAADVCGVLGIANVGNAISRLESGEYSDIRIPDVTGRLQDIKAVNEQGLYRLIFRSNKEEAKRFQNWVFGEVLPSIRKTGGYQIHEAPKPMSIPEQIGGIRDAYSLLEDFGLADDACRILARESIQSLLRMLGAPGGILPQIPQSTRLNERHFMIEDLRNDFPEFTSKFWLENRGAFGKAVKANIQKVSPDCEPYKIFKDVNESERQVNAWPMAYREIAIEAIRNYAKKLLAKVN